MTKTQPDPTETMTGAMQRFYDMQMALQHDAFESTRSGLLGAVAMQRAGMNAMTRAMDAAVDAIAPGEGRGAWNATAWTRIMPLSPEAAEKLAEDATASMMNVQSTFHRAGVAMRDATREATTRYDGVLGSMEETSAATVTTAEENAQKAVMVAGRVMGAWTEAMMGAMRATATAMEEAQSAVVETTRGASGDKSGKPGKKA